ncbi:MAG: Heat shock protein HtpX [Micavibrio sp.]|nr:Heat shock protein HtpX [Micavibrio sp.]
MPQHAIGLKSLIWNNNLRSLGLLLAYPLVMLAVLWGIGYITAATGMNNIRPVDPIMIANRWLYDYWPLMTGAVAIWFTIAWFFQTSMIRAVSHARPVTRLEEPALYNLLENLCISRGIKMPALEVIDDPALNAFASGTGDSTYSITVTRGLLDRLPPDELEAVLGHELTHIINRDVRLLIVTVIFTGMFGFLAQILWSNFRYSMWLPRSNDNSRRGGAVFFYLAILAIVFCGYLVSTLARFAISRNREYMADAGSIELTRNPEAMMRALMRISGHDRIDHVTDDVSMMCIENSKAFLGLFATHPSIEDRVRTISAVTGTTIPALSATPAAELSPESRNPWL